MTLNEWIAILSGSIVLLLGIIGFGIQSYISAQKEEHLETKEMLKGFSSRVNRQMEKFSIDMKNDLMALSDKSDKTLEHINNVEKRLMAMNYEKEIKTLRSNKIL